MRLRPYPLAVDLQIRLFTIPTVDIVIIKAYRYQLLRDIRKGLADGLAVIAVIAAEIIVSSQNSCPVAGRGASSEGGLLKETSDSPSYGSEYDYQDWVQRVEFTYDNTEGDGTLELKFGSTLNSDATYESWGIDNVKVKRQLLEDKWVLLTDAGNINPDAEGIYKIDGIGYRLDDTDPANLFLEGPVSESSAVYGGDKVYIVGGTDPAELSLLLEATGVPEDVNEDGTIDEADEVYWTSLLSQPLMIESKGLSFDGTYDSVTVETVDLEDFAGWGEGTISLWFNADTFSPYQWNDMLFSNRYDWLRLAFDSDGDGLVWQLYNGATYSAETTTSFVPGAWYHVAVTYGADGMQIFVNGQLEGSNSFTGAPQANTEEAAQFIIGNTYTTWWGGKGFDGTIDEVAIYSTALDQTEIQTLMDSKLAGTETGLVASYQFDDGTASDITGGGNTGIIHGAQSVDSEKGVVFTEEWYIADINGDGSIDGYDFLMLRAAKPDTTLVREQALEGDIYYMEKGPEDNYYIYTSEGELWSGKPGDTVDIKGIGYIIIGAATIEEAYLKEDRTGDINKDGEVDEVDELIVVRHVLGIEGEYSTNADLDSDGDNDGEDLFIFKMQRASANSISRLVELGGAGYYLSERDNKTYMLDPVSGGAAIYTALIDGTDDTALYNIQGVDYLVHWAQDISDVWIKEMTISDLDGDFDVDTLDWTIMEQALGSVRKADRNGVETSARHNWQEEISFGDSSSLHAGASSVDNWIEYEFEVLQAGGFDFEIEVKNGAPYTTLPDSYNYTFDLSVDGILVGTISVPGSDTDYNTAAVSLADLAEGTHTFKLTWTNASAALVGREPGLTEPRASIVRVSLVSTNFDERADLNKDGTISSEDVRLFLSMYSDESLVQSVVIAGKSYYAIESHAEGSYIFYDKAGNKVISYDTQDIQSERLYRFEYELEDFESGALGWSEYTTSTCNGTTILGGYGNFGEGITAVRDYPANMVDVRKYDISFDYYYIDAWSNDEAYLDINDQRVWTQSHYYNDDEDGLLEETTDSPSYGYSGYDYKDWVQHVELTHEADGVADALELEFGSTLSGDGNYRSWGVDNVHVTAYGIISDRNVGQFAGERVQLDGVEYAITKDTQGVITLVSVTDIDGDTVITETDSEVLEGAVGSSAPFVFDGDEYSVEETTGHLNFLRFDGSTEGKVTASYQVADGLSDFSITTRMKLDPASSGVNSIVSMATGARDNELLIYYNKDTSKWYVWVDNTAYSFNSSGSSADGYWHTVCVTREGAKLSLYIDGTLTGERLASDDTINVTKGGLVIGQEQDEVGGGFDAAEAFKGDLDDISIWRRALGASEIAMIHGGRSLAEIDGFGDDCRAWWTFDATDGGTALDLSNNGYNAEISGASSESENITGFTSAARYIYADPLDLDRHTYQVAYKFGDVFGSGNYRVGLDVRTQGAKAIPEVFTENFLFRVEVDGRDMGVLEIVPSRFFYASGDIEMALGEGEHTIKYTWLNPEIAIGVDIGRSYIEDTEYVKGADIDGDGVIGDNDIYLMNLGRIKAGATQSINLDGTDYFAVVDTTTGKVVLDDGQGRRYTNEQNEYEIKNTIDIPLASDPDTIVQYIVNVDPDTASITLVERNIYDLNQDGNFDKQDLDVLLRMTEAKLMTKDGNDIKNTSGSWSFNADDTISNGGFAGPDEISPWVEYIVEIEEAGQYYAGLSYGNDTAYSKANNWTLPWGSDQEKWEIFSDDFRKDLSAAAYTTDTGDISGSLKMEITGDDPALYYTRYYAYSHQAGCSQGWPDGTNTAVDMDETKYVEIRYRYTGDYDPTTASISWSAHDREYPLELKDDLKYTRSFDVTGVKNAEGEYITVLLDMDSIEGWTGEMEAFRFDPADGGVGSGTVEVQYIAFKDSETALPSNYWGEYPGMPEEELRMRVYADGTYRGTISVPRDKAEDPPALHRDALKVELDEGVHTLKFEWINDQGEETAVRVGEVFFSDIENVLADSDGDYVVDESEQVQMQGNVGIQVSDENIVFGEMIYEVTPAGEEYTLKGFTDSSDIFISDPGSRTVKIDNVTYDIHVNGQGIITLAARGLLSVPTFDGEIEFNGVEYAYDATEGGLYRFTRTTKAAEAYSAQGKGWDSEIKIGDSFYGVVESLDGKITLIPAERAQVFLTAASEGEGESSFLKNDYPMVPSGGDFWRNGYGSTNGWAPEVTSTANGTTILGGYDNFGKDATAVKIYKNIPQEEITISFDYYYFDAWWNNQAYLDINGQRVWAQTHYYYEDEGGLLEETSDSPSYGREGSWKDWVQHVELVYDNTGGSGTLELEFGSTLNNSATDASWGIDNVEVTDERFDDFEEGAGFNTSPSEWPGDGINITVIDEDTAEVEFTSWDVTDPAIVERMVSYLRGLSEDTIILASKQGNWGETQDVLGAEACRVFESAGSLYISAVSDDDAWSMIGYIGAEQGDAGISEQYNPDGSALTANNVIYLKDGPHPTSHSSNTKIKVDEEVYNAAHNSSGALELYTEEEFDSFLHAESGQQKIEIDGNVYQVTIDGDRPVLYDADAIITEDGRGAVYVDGNVYSALMLTELVNENGIVTLNGKDYFLIEDGSGTQLQPVLPGDLNTDGDVTQDDVGVLSGAMGSARIDRKKATDSVYYNFFAKADELYATSKNTSPAPYLEGIFVNGEGSSNTMRVGLKVTSYQGRPVPAEGFRFNVQIKKVTDLQWQDKGEIAIFCSSGEYGEEFIAIAGMETGEYQVRFTWINQDEGTAIQVKEYYLEDVNYLSSADLNKDGYINTTDELLLRESFGDSLPFTTLEIYDPNNETLETCFATRNPATGRYHFYFGQDEFISGDNRRVIVAKEDEVVTYEIISEDDAYDADGRLQVELKVILRGDLNNDGKLDPLDDRIAEIARYLSENGAALISIEELRSLVEVMNITAEELAAANINQDIDEDDVDVVNEEDKAMLLTIKRFIDDVLSDTGTMESIPDTTRVLMGESGEIKIYDASDDMLWKKLFPDGRMWRYDKTGRVVEEIDEVGTRLFYQFDEIAGTTSVTDKSTDEIKVYDQDGRLISFTDSEGAQHDYTYADKTIYMPNGHHMIFDGRDDYLTVENSSVLDLVDNSFTITQWVRFDSFNSLDSFDTFMWHGDGASSNSFQFDYDNSNSQLRFVYYTGSTNIISRSWTPEMNKWYSLAFVRDGTGASLFVNGEALGTSETMTGILNTVTDQLYIGARPASPDPDREFSGDIDEVAIFGRALTQSEIRVLTSAEPTTYAADLTAYYSFNDGTAVDNSTGGNDGTIHDASSSKDPEVAPIGQSGVYTSMGFDGETDSVKVESIKTANFSDWGEGTISLWFKADTISYYGDYWGYWRDILFSARGEQFALAFEADGHLRWQLVRGDNSQREGIESITSDFVPGQWYHVAVTYGSGDGMQIFINGQLETANEFTGAPLGNNDEASQFIIGNNSDVWWGSQGFDGAIDEVAVYSRAITQAEIQALMNTAPEASANALEAYYSFNDGTASDSSNAANNGTTNGALSIRGTYREPIVPLEGTYTTDAIVQYEETLPGQLVPVREFYADGKLLKDYTDSDVTVKEYEYYLSGELAGKIKTSIQTTTLNNTLSMSFDKTAYDQVRIPDSPELDMTDALTVAAWVKVGVADYFHDAVADYGSQGWAWMLRTSASDNKFWPHINTENGGHNAQGSVLPVGEWVHLALTYNGEVLQGYVNGVLDCINTSPSGNIRNYTQDITISGTAHGYEYFDGNVDEVAIFSRVLSEEELQRLMNTRLTGEEEALAAYYSFDDGTATDNSGGGNDGVISGASTQADYPSVVGEKTASSEYEYYTEPSPFAGQVSRITYKDGTWSNYFYSNETGRLARTEDSDGTVRYYRYTSSEDRTFVLKKVLDLGGTLLTVEQDSSTGTAVYTFRTSTRVVGSGSIGDQFLFGGKTYQIVGTGLEDISLRNDDVAINTCLEFDGTNDYVEVPDNASLNPSQLTAEAWVKVDTEIGHSTKTVVSKGDQAYLMQIYDGNVNFVSRNSLEQYQALQGSLTVQPGVWTHIAVTHDGSTKRIYVNGVEDPLTAAHQGLWIEDTDPLRVGSRRWDWDRFGGAIDEVAVWDRALTQQEIQTRVNTKLAGTEEGLIVYYSFDDGTATDNSTAGNDAVVYEALSADSDVELVASMNAQAITAPIVLERDVFKTLGEVKMDRLVMEEYRTEEISVASARVDYSLPGYSIAETVDGVKDSQDNGWSTGERASPSTAVFEFDALSKVSSVVLTQGAATTAGNMLDFGIYYTDDKTPELNYSLWQPVENLSITNLGGIYYEDGCHAIVDVPGEDIYQITFDVAKMTALMLRVNDGVENTTNFILNEIEIFGESTEDQALERGLDIFENTMPAIDAQDVYASAREEDKILEFDMTIGRATAEGDIPELTLEIGSYVITGTLSGVDASGGLLEVSGREVIAPSEISFDGELVSLAELSSSFADAEARGLAIRTDSAYTVVRVPEGWKIAEAAMNFYTVPTVSTASVSGTLEEVDFVSGTITVGGHQIRIYDPTLDGSFRKSGDAAFFIQPKYTGLYPAASREFALQAGDIDNNQTSVIEKEVTVTDSEFAFSFWWKASSEADKDYFSFYVDEGSGYGLVDRISGEDTGWRQWSGTYSPGTYMFKWEYSKDGAGSAGLDTAWLDDITYQDAEEELYNFNDGTLEGFVSSKWFNDNGRATSGTPIDGGIHTIAKMVEISEETKLEFDWTVDTHTSNSMSFYIDGLLQDTFYGTGAGSASESKTYYLPVGTYDLEWTFERAGSDSSGADRGWIDNVELYPSRMTIIDTFTPNDVQTVTFNGETLASLVDLEKILAGETIMPAGEALRTGGDSPFIAIADYFKDAGHILALQAGDITDGQRSVVEKRLEFKGDTDVSFQWKVSSEADHDFFRLYVDDVLVDALSGEEGWTEWTGRYSSGTHLFRWEYSKDSNGISAGDDTAWMDNFRYASVVEEVYDFDAFKSGPSLQRYGIEGTWTRGGTQQLSTSYNGFARSTAYDNEDIVDYTHRYMTKTVTVPEGENVTLGFNWKVDAHSNNYLSFLIDEVEQDKIYGTIGGDWTTSGGYALSAGTYQLKWDYYQHWDSAAGTNTGYVDDLRFTKQENKEGLFQLADLPVVIIDGVQVTELAELQLDGQPVSTLSELKQYLEEAMGEGGLLRTSGDASFFINADAVDNYKDQNTFMALQSGAISDGQTSAVEKVLTFDGDTDVSFWWKTSSEDLKYSFSGRLENVNLEGNTIHISGEEISLGDPRPTVTLGGIPVQWEKLEEEALYHLIGSEVTLTQTAGGWQFETDSFAFSGPQAITAATYTTDSTEIALQAQTIKLFDPETLAEYNKYPQASDAAFFLQSNERYTGDYAIQAGAISESQRSVIEREITLDAPGQIDFWWKASSEEGSDFFKFYVDEEQYASISGETGWERMGAATSADDFETGAEGWSDTQTSFCNNTNILGGYGVFGGTSSSKTFTGVPQGEVTISFDYYFIDSWDGDRYAVDETAYLDINGERVWTRIHDVTAPDQSDGLQQIPDIGGTYGEDWVLPVEIVYDNTGGSDALELTFGATLNEDKYNESWGIDNVLVGVDANAIPIISAGEHTLMWEYSKDATGIAGQDTAWLDEFKVTVYPDRTYDFEAGNMDDFSTTNCDVQNGTVQVEQNGEFTKTISSPVESVITFDWKASIPYGALRFYVDGVEKEAITDEAPWQQGVYTVSAGTHTLRWYYDSWGWDGSYENRAWVDNIVLPAGGTVLVEDGFTPVAQEIYFDGQLISFDDLEGKIEEVKNTSGRGLEVTSSDVTAGVFTEGTISFRSKDMPEVSDISGVLAGVDTESGTLIINGGFGDTVVQAPASILLDGQEVTLQALADWFLVAQGSDKFDIRTLGNSGVEDTGTAIVLSADVLDLKLVKSPGVTENDQDLFRFYVNGVETAAISGEVPWIQWTDTFSAGTYAFKWEYSKDSVGSAGEDTAWLDGFTAVTGVTELYDFANSQTEGTGLAGDWYGDAEGYARSTESDNEDLYAEGGDGHREMSKVIIVPEGQSVALKFDWKAYAYDQSYLSFIINDVEMDAFYGTSTGTDWQTMQYYLPAGTYTTKWDYYQYEGTAGWGMNTGYIDNLEIVATPPAAGLYGLDDFQDVLLNGEGMTVSELASLDPPITTLAELEAFIQNSRLEQGFQTGGDAPFFMRSDMKGDYKDSDSLLAFQAGAISDNERSFMEKTVVFDADTDLSFWWKASSEEGKDKFRFYVNGTERAAISGEDPWREWTGSFSAGTYRLVWEYSKDSAGTIAEDTAWLDDFSYTYAKADFSYDFNDITGGDDLQLEQAAELSAGGWARDKSTYLRQEYNGFARSTAYDNEDLYADGGDGYRYMTRAVTVSEGPDATLTFDWKIDAYQDSHVRFLVNDVEQNKIKGTQDWQTKEYTLSPGTYELKWEYCQYDQSYYADSGKNTGYVDNITMTIPETVGGICDLADLPEILLKGESTTKTLSELETLLGGSFSTISELEQLIKQKRIEAGFINAGDATFFIRADAEFEYKDGDTVMALQAGEIADDQSTFVQKTVTLNADTNLSFWWKVSSEEGKDFFRFYADGAEVAAISGERPWSMWNGTFGAGMHTFRWEYAKDGSGSAGEDTAWLDGFGGTYNFVSSYDFNYDAPGPGGLPEDLVGAWYRIDEGYARSNSALESSQMTKTVTVPEGTEGTIKFDWKIGAPDEHYLAFFVDGVEQDRIAGSVDWETNKQYVLPAGTYELKWAYTGDTTIPDNGGYVDNYYLAISAPDSLPALYDEPSDFPEVMLNGVYTDVATLIGTVGTFTTLSGLQQLIRDVRLSEGGFRTTGDAPFFAQSQTRCPAAGSGITSTLQAGDIGHNQTSVATKTVTLENPGIISFWWKVSSEEGKDFARFYVNGEEVDPVSGEMPWEKWSREYPAGTYNLRWEYTKDGEGSAGEDTAWLDYLTYTTMEEELYTFDDFVGDALEGFSGDWYKDRSEKLTATFNGRATSGTPDENSHRTMTKTITVPEDAAATLEFDWKVLSGNDTPLGADNYLRFYINGIEQDRVIGQNVSENKSYILPGGTYELKWTFYNGYGEYEPSQEPGAWVDNVRIFYNDTVETLFELDDFTQIAIKGQATTIP
ncbi:LamG-like jellyroll fold domain-containing protein, partial [Candidatus Omnitrophota bacterium]